MKKERKTWRYAVLLSTTVGRWLAQQCNKENKSYSAYIRHLINEEYHRQEQCKGH